MGMLCDRLRKQTALVETDVTRRGADQARYGICLLYTSDAADE